MKNALMLLVIAGFIALPFKSFAQTTPTEVATAADITTDINKDDLKAEVDSLQEDILGNEELMKEIEELLKDEEIVKLLSNPELVSAITSYDPTKIEANTNVQELMKNPKVNALIEKIGKLYETQNAADNAETSDATAIPATK